MKNKVFKKGLFEFMNLFSYKKYIKIIKEAHKLALFLDNDIGMDKPELTHLWQALGEIGIERSFQEKENNIFFELFENLEELDPKYMDIVSKNMKKLLG